MSSKASFVFFAVLLFSVVLAACGQDTPLGLESALPTSLMVAGNSPIHTLTPAPGERRSASSSGPLQLPACAPTAASPVEPPDPFAPDFPFPPGLRLNQNWRINDDPNYVQVIGYAPVDFLEAVSFILAELPKRGYTLGRGDQESNEAEAQYSGHGWRGAFRIRTVVGCEGITEWLILAVKR